MLTASPRARRVSQFVSRIFSRRHRRRSRRIASNWMDRSRRETHPATRRVRHDRATPDLLPPLIPPEIPTGWWWRWRRRRGHSCAAFGVLLWLEIADLDFALRSWPFLRLRFPVHTVSFWRLLCLFRAVLSQIWREVTRRSWNFRNHGFRG
jgi:hypothetical protein